MRRERAEDAGGENVKLVVMSGAFSSAGLVKTVNGKSDPQVIPSSSPGKAINIQASNLK
ncbi:hypothetical protein GCM10009103_54820 [Pseudomonas koreensis]|nr:hypothetical protein GCM10009103_54820 [Pseudomonas koreensis]